MRKKSKKRNILALLLCSCMFLCTGAAAVHADGRPEYGQTIRQFRDSYGDDIYYFLYDLDKDGIEELFLSYGTCMADWSNNIYTVMNGRIKFLGELSSYHGYYENENGKGLLAVWGRMGYERITVIQKEGTRFITDIGEETYIGDRDYYSNNHPISMKPIAEYGR